MNVAGVRDFDDLIALHDVAANPRHPAIRFVVCENIAAVVSPVRVGHMGMVGISVGEDTAALFQELFCCREQPLSENLPTLVGKPPTRGAVIIEDRNAHKLSTRRKADYAHLAGLAAAGDAVILVQIAGPYLRVLASAALREPFTSKPNRTGAPR